MMASKENIEVEIHESEEKESNMSNMSKEGDEVKSVDDMESKEKSIRQKRRLMRARITRTVKRILLSITTGKLTEKRAERELVDLKEDYKTTLSLHSEFYEFENEMPDVLDKWENDLTEVVYDVEERIQEYIDWSGKGQRKTKRKQKIKSSIEDTAETDDDDDDDYEVEEEEESLCSSTEKSADGNTTKVDSWIDELVDYTETKFSEPQNEMTIAQALYRIEASRETPTLQLPLFNGEPLKYVDFVDAFRIHIHQKHNLTDDHRMGQLKMHLTGEADRSISGLGSSGIMYATALKTIKEQFGHPSRIARAFIKQLINGEKIKLNDRNGLRNFSIDIINCLATLTRLRYLGDVNTVESLRKIIQRLPDYIIIRWKTKVTDIREKGGVPDLDEISKFLRKIVKAEFDPDFGDLERSSKYDSKDKPTTNLTMKRGVNSTEKFDQRMRCYHCKQNHRINNCPTFLNLPINDRVAIIRDNRLCFSCLIRGHGVKECRSKKACGKNGCTRIHNELIHFDPPNTSVSSASALDNYGILPVIRVTFRAPNGRTREGNVLIDGGAGTTIIRTKFARDLGLQGKREEIELSVVGGKQVSQKSSRRVSFWISPLHNNEQQYEIEAHEIDTTVNSVGPLNRKWLSTFDHLKGIDFPHQDGSIDMVLGVQYSHLHADQEVREGKPYEPIAKLSRLGWYVMGSESLENSSIASINFIQKIDIEKMYELETLGIQAPNCSCPKTLMSADDRRAMELFEASCRKEGDRYMIGVPWKRDKSELPNNYYVAEKRLLALEKNLQRDPKKAELYCKAISEYEVNGWSEKIQEETSDTTYYLPHHGVYRAEKVSTPLRVVFDPACYCKGVTLNSFMYKGPSLLGNLFSTLLRFREEPVAFVGDISKMYLQIRLLESDTQVHRYLWRNLDVSREPSIYRMMTVTFGDKASPDMANFVMLKMASENEETYPEASRVLRDDRYMDDILHSCSSNEKATELTDDLDQILKTGSFQIKQWISSAKDEQMEPNQSTLQIPDTSEEVQENIKTLGILWNYKTDTFHFRVKKIILQEYTRRSLLSQIAQLYDPLGLAAVVTIRSRIAMQNLWKLKDYTWDDSLPEEQSEVWKNIFEDLESLNDVQYRRCLKPENAVGKPELHVFADASNDAYGSCAYLLWHTEGPTSVKLVAAKARVAPLRQSTIPRLELMAALTASRLARTIINSLRSDPDVYLWSDSKIVLHWLKSESSTLKPFVGVRVAEIQAEWPSENWKYVPTKMNPADDLSRGVKVKKIKDSWFEGPEFLQLPKAEWPLQDTNTTVTEDTETKKSKKTLCSLKKEKYEPFIDCQNFSSWKRLLHVTAYCFRFIETLKQRIKRKSEIKDGLQPEEIQKAENYWISEAQRKLENWEKYAELSPFEQDGLIRVGGRLRHSALDYEQRHPVLMISSHHVSVLILRYIHEKLYHAGAERTLAESRRKYWFLRGRNAVKYMVRKCTVCRKLRQPPHEPFMSDLPAERVNPVSPPFATTGVDLFGPFSLRYGRNKQIKAWGAVFTCAVTRALHLEIVENLSTDAFLHALRRFAATYGWPSTVISDNGTSFVGANKEVSRLFTEDREIIQDFSANHRMRWKFITPLSPHQGGFYESMVKQVKRAIQVSVGSQVLTWNEATTVFAEVKGLINSRPLGVSSSDPNDLQPLTPNHFLIGRASTHVPQIDVEEVKCYKRRFEFVQCLVSQIWRRFIREYLPTLMNRVKWRHPARQVTVGDIVLLVNYNLPRGQWQLARVTEVFPGNDGTVRNVAVKTKQGLYKRSVQKCIVVLENDVDN